MTEAMTRPEAPPTFKAPANPTTADLSSAFGVLGTLLELQTPRDQSSILFSNRGGAGKTFLGVNIMAINAQLLGIYEIENIKFVQAYWNEKDEKVKIGPNLVSPHPRVRYVTSLVEWWLAYAQILKEDPSAYIAIDLDELQKWNPSDQHYTPLAHAFASIWTENRKFRLIPKLYCQQMRKLPTPFKPTINWYISKSSKMADEYNSQYGTDYDAQKLAFIINVEGRDLDDEDEDSFELSDVKEVLYVDRGPWTGDINKPVAGQFYYQSRGVADFELGTLNDDEDWHIHLLKSISKVSSFAISDAIFAFFEKRTKVSVTQWASQAYRTAQARAWYSHHSANGSVEKDGVFRILVNVEGKHKLVKLEPTSGNISRLFDIPKSTVIDHLGKLDKGGNGIRDDEDEPPVTKP